MFWDSLIRNIVEGIIFLLITIFVFNELTTLLKTLDIFTSDSIKHLGLTSILFALDNMLSQRFFNIQLIR